MNIDRVISDAHKAVSDLNKALSYFPSYGIKAEIEIFDIDYFSSIDGTSRHCTVSFETFIKVKP